jgi:hypothetical protein
MSSRLGALGHIGAEHVKEYFIHACWGSSKLTLNTWLGLIDMFDHNMNSTITGHGLRRLGSPSIALFECAIGHCDYESIKKTGTCPTRGELGAHRYCLSKKHSVISSREAKPIKPSYFSTKISTRCNAAA